MQQHVDLTRSRSRWTTAVLLRRVLWQWLLGPVAYWLPRPLGRLRLRILAMMGAEIDFPCLVRPRVRILMPWNLRLGARRAIAEGTNLYNYARITVGTHSVVSQGAYLCTGTHDYTDPHMPLTWEPITIGPQAWVCAEAFVGPGVTIGEGAVIGARAVVTRDMPEWTVCAGNPCKPIKPRVMRETGAVPASAATR